MEQLRLILSNARSICARHSLFLEIEHEAIDSTMAQVRVIYMDAVNAPAAIHHMIGGNFHALPLDTVLQIDVGDGRPKVKQLSFDGTEKETHKYLLESLFEDLRKTGCEVIPKKGLHVSEDEPE